MMLTGGPGEGLELENLNILSSDLLTQPLTNGRGC